MAAMNIQPMLEQVNYMFLFKYTQKGAEQLSLSPARVENANKFVKDIHAFCAFVSLSGEYDMMTFFSGLPDEAYQLLLYLKSLGTVEVTMLRIEKRSLKDYKTLLGNTFRIAGKKARK